MSLVLNGVVTNTDLSKNSKGGTELMRDRLLTNIDPELLQDVAIHFSRSTGRSDEASLNIFYAHDLSADSANIILLNEGWKDFDFFVFVSHWQRQEYMLRYGIPQSLTTVIQNAIEEKSLPIREHNETKRFIYHTTPHRGLELLVPVFDQLSKEHDVHLDVYSSFSIYGWNERDKPYENLFSAISSHEHMSYHGAQPNSVVLSALEKADFFLYPSIWQETSCIALIEAMTYGVIGIVPDFGALPETAAAGPSIVYDWHEDPYEHMNRAYSAAKQVLEADPYSINRFVAESFTPKSKVHSVNHFAEKWSLLLASLKEAQSE